MPASPYTETFRIRSYEIGPDARALPQTLCNYLQEAAGLHAQQIGVSVEDLAAQNLTWVLARLHVRFDAYPAWGDVVHVRTWPSGATGLQATRAFEVEDDAGRLIGVGTSGWLMLDIERRRPIRIPDFIHEIRLPDRPDPLPDAFPKLPAPEEVAFSRTFGVRRSDLDLNDHVNNVRYVEWAVETVPPEAVEGLRLGSLEVQYKAETLYGDDVLVEVGADPEHEGTFHHRLRRTRDDRDLALIRTTWSA